MRFHIPIKLPSLANTRWHWRKMASVKKKHRNATRHALLSTFGARIPPLPLLITITRVGPRKLDDDNLASACKYVRDQIAASVGVDDGSPLYTWCYEQKTGKYGVDVEITSR